MKRVLLASAALAIVVVLPASAQQPAFQFTLDIHIPVTFTATNPCNSDLISSSGDLHIHQHLVSPEGADEPGLVCHVLDHFNGSGTGSPSELTYHVRIKGGFTGVNGILKHHPANGALAFQDDVSFTFDPIGAGSQGQKFTARLLQGTAIPDNSDIVNTHLQFDPGSCNN